MSGARTVLVEAPARLHLGLIDLRGDVGRRFGGIGAALESPSLLLEARPAESLSAEGAEAERLLLYGRRFLEYHKIEGGAALHVRRAFPAHAGLGSGTQLALATARALATLFDRSAGVVELAKATCRGQRSAIGTYAFEQGGFVLEGGRRTSGDGPAPLLLRQAVPAAWRCLVVIPDVPRGLSGAAEEEAFRTMPPPPAELGERIAHRILMLVLPALAEADLPAFGRGITEVQALVGEMFRPVQGERFAHAQVAELVKALLAAGAAGAGQSSWGPAVFGFFASEDEARRAEGRVAGSGAAFVTPFNNTGARSWTP
jgi:beta-ribofuranosylaminobenzene 5'-phosphate synthase